jgi:L-threonylcarbamoyladenylate synthase
MGTRKRRVSVIYFISKLLKWDDLRMEIIFNCTQDSIKKAAKALKDGHLVAFPTETVYGLGADASNPTSVARIYEVKGRPTDHPLIVHISSISHMDKWAVDVPEYAINLARNFWPGPVTLILKRSQIAKDFITGGQNLVGLRVPSHPTALMLMKEFENLGGFGVAAPSANRFGAVSPTTSDAVLEELGTFLSGKDFVLDGGSSEVGIESTIIDCSGEAPNILRPGIISKEQVEGVSGLQSGHNISGSKVRTSGLLISHYSPVAEVVLDGKTSPEDGFFAMAEIQTPTGAIRLGSPATIEDYAKNLYSVLRLADQKGLKRISVIQPSGDGLAVAIRDRLSKAAAR